MNRNTEAHFAELPNIDIQRSTLNRPQSVKLSGNVGDIIPFYVDEVLPGDTFDVKTSKVIRFQTMRTPVMDNMYMDFYYFFVPNRLTWEHWREMNGENTQSPWIQQVDYEVPQITSPETTGWIQGTIADYMGIPIGVDGLSVSALPFRAYALICNEFFRDENLMSPLAIPVSDSTVAGSNGDTFVSDVAKGGMPYKASKYHDYFTSALPSPQKGPDVAIPVAEAGPYPVVPLGTQVPLTDQLKYNTVIRVYNTPNSNYYGGGIGPENTLAGNWRTGTAFSQVVNRNDPDTESKSWFANLWAINDGTAIAATINQLRLAYQIQKLYERDARGGTRYIELLKSHFGVTSPDSRLQRPEYLGGNRVPIHINQVIQQSATSSDEYLGDVAAMSVTTDSHSDFRHSFTEHGFVIGVMVCRYDHTYQQGLERFWSRKDRFDFYWPVFANIGEQAILNKEIYATGTSSDDEVFGYQEAWAEYRYKPNRVAGEMRSTSTLPLDSWHLADYYVSQPYLSAGWIVEDQNTVDRVLNVSSAVSNQFWADIYIQNKSTRPMPVYSVPGFVDHH